MRTKGRALLTVQHVCGHATQMEPTANKAEDLMIMGILGEKPCPSCAFGHSDPLTETIIIDPPYDETDES